MSSDPVAVSLFPVPLGTLPVGGRIELRAEVRNSGSSPWGGAVAITRDDGQVVVDTRVDLAPGEATSVSGFDVASRPGALGWSVAAGAATAEHRTFAVASESKALPWFQGVWFDPGAVVPPPVGYDFSPVFEPDDVAAMVDDVAALGVSMLVVTYVEASGGFYYPSEIEFHDRDLGVRAGGSHLEWDYLDVVLSTAARHGMGVFLGLGRGGDTPLLWEFDAEGWDDRNDFALDLGRRVSDELWERYRHHPSLYGWYLTHEMNDLARAGAYYDPLARHLRTLSPGRPVLAAPSGTPIVDRDVIAASEVDVFAYQDAAGAGYVPYEYTWDPERRIAGLDEVYGSYVAAHQGAGKHCWADLEVWEMDGSAGYSGAYPPAWDRVRRQLEVAARHVEVVTAYEWSGFMQHEGQRPRRPDDRAAELYRGYARHVEEQRARQEALRAR